MGKGLFITGTDTDVGKTAISAALTYFFASKGYDVQYYKPLLSGAEMTPKGWLPGDAAFVVETARLSEAYDLRVPYCFETPVSPHLAAQLEQKSVDPQKLIDGYQHWLSNADLTLVEGAGGIGCPLIERASDRPHEESVLYMTTDLIKDLALEGHSLLVCRAGVGTLSHTLTAVRYAQAEGLHLLGLIVNGYEETLACQDNLRLLEKMTDLPILAVFPKLEGPVTPDRIRATVDTYWKALDPTTLGV